IASIRIYERLAKRLPNAVKLGPTRASPMTSTATARHKPLRQREVTKSSDKGPKGFTITGEQTGQQIASPSNTLCIVARRCDSPGFHRVIRILIKIHNRE
ncbi:17895_t:CDS:1, partial [Acaulospora morrowiae]